MAENKPPLKISALDPITTPTATSILPISSDTATNKITFADLTKQFAKKTDLNGLEKTTDANNKFALKTELTPITTAIGTIQEEITTLQQADGVLEPKVEQLILDVAKLKTDVTKLQTDYVTINSRLAALETPETP